MKKYIGFTLGLLLMFSPVYASTQDQLVSALQQVIVLLEQEIQILMAQLSQISTQTSTPPVASSTNFGGVQPVVSPIIQPIINQIIMPTESQLVCTLSADTNAGAPSSYVNITWTSNADDATITNSHINYSPSDSRLDPASGGTKPLKLSSESGENNVFTAHFILKEQTKDCTASVLTQ